jgi:hypothetical protein
MGMMLDSNTSDDTPIVESWMGQIKESTETLDPDEIDVATETAKRLRIQTDAQLLMPREKLDIGAETIEFRLPDPESPNDNS